ncbi:hypothetical protein Glove_139g337 [Diversispora epigaea]|uniref:Uncharacterized protein n=1 Tax=Diversispora epigaea TaxID=1348612 RepID=A0A397IW11_9GLOM|nr:hypothetical protein Glove_139g337 [Diversispora epigaea]
MITGTLNFGSDIGRLHQYSIEIYNTSNTSTSRKRSLFIVQSKSGQNKYFAFLGIEHEKLNVMNLYWQEMDIGN